LYKEVLGKKYDKVSFKRPRSEKKLPKVIDSELDKIKINFKKVWCYQTFFYFCVVGM
jgi:hypothetical protein